MKRINLKKACVKITHFPVVCLLLACCMLNACSSDEEPSGESGLPLVNNLFIAENDTIAYDASETAKPFNTVEKKINLTLEEYAVTMLVDYSKKTKKNTVLSPMSATLLYSMISNLSDDNTGYSCKKQLGIENYTDDDVNSYCRKLNYQSRQSENNTDNGSKFSMSNNCWIKQKETVYKSFMSMTKSFGIDVNGVDFKSQSGLNAIGNSLNGLVKTNSSEIDMTSIGDVTSVVTTSMNLQKAWKNKLSYYDNDSIFNNADGSISICKKIGAIIKLNYAEMSTFKMAELPYTDENFSLYVVYPKSASLLEQSLKYVQDNGLEKCIANLKETEIVFNIPELQLKGVTELNSSSGSGESGGKQFYMAKLSKASSKGFSISNTYQAYRIELDRNGTSFEVQSTGISPTTPIIAGHQGASPGVIIPVQIPEMKIDHPFFIFIRNNNIKATVYACCIKDLSGK